MHDFVARWARVAPDRVAIRDVDGARDVTYAALDARAARLATALTEGLGLARGDRVAALTAGRVEVLEAYLACARAGLVFVPLNTRLAPARLDGLIAHARPAALLYDDAFAPLTAALAASAPPPRRIALGDARVAGDDLAWEALVAAAAPRRAGPIDLEAVSLILYTSGTTGAPKGVMIPWRQVVFNAVNTALACDLRATDRALAALPLFHTGGLHCLATPLLHRGGSVALTAGFDPERAASMLRSGAVTTTIAVPTMYGMLEDAGLLRDPAPTALRSLLVGGAPCPIPLLERYHAAGLPLRQGYGLTEVGPNCFTLSPLAGPHRLGTVGWPAFHGEARLVDDDGVEVGPDTPGELLLRGPHVTAGYYGDPDETARALDADGWFRTGDVLSRSDDGCFRVVDRKKEMYISGGENVYPAAVELALSRHPDVTSVAVLPFDDARWGQVGVAALALRPGADRPGDEALRAFARGLLASYEVPKRWVVLPSLPLNASGKVDRAALRALVAASTP